MKIDPIISGQLPERVQEAIFNQQNKSEILVGWFQLSIVSLFGILYTVSPKTFSSQNTFTLVPWFLAIYFILTCARILLAQRGRLSTPLLYLSVLADIGLLLSMIWAFHLQYNQPPTFYLKSPTLLYVFIFIALRTLRFEARYVVTAGIIAALGWIGLSFYAGYVSGGIKMVTRDYVHYMTSNSILVGAELDKTITILTVTAILAVAITRARRLMVQAVVEGAAARDLARFFSPEIARKIVASEKQIRAGQGQIRHAAIFNCDIRGFTRMAGNIEPDVLMSLLAEYQALIIPIIHQHGGAIDKFMGDGIMATFGAALPSETYAADALRATDEVLSAVDLWNETLTAHNRPQIRIGAAVSTGQIIFGAVGDADRLEYTVIGDAVNLCAKLEKHNKTEGVRALTTENTYTLAFKQGFRFIDEDKRLKQRRVEGVDDPINLIVLAN
ncbi:MAG: adenylate/guanylate cyclase domain-containing protein [Pseudomonadota bacterium]